MPELLEGGVRERTKSTSWILHPRQPTLKKPWSGAQAVCAEHSARVCLSCIVTDADVNLLLRYWLRAYVIMNPVELIVYISGWHASGWWCLQ